DYYCQTWETGIQVF
nr:immunoglobulin light chain junction region [Macaca mulatta]MOV67138.1 immunoglobulin light chain junction region [Macaca mulatta]MOV67205.1 immunoglobulin light chain junction region [Macaca mulatta]MOV67330.1 immunoglobulin light chain junction region [Macaca mulatta]MOV67349.1 immunoglobulin light chain junction region [Macaca mulatta]